MSWLKKKETPEQQLKKFQLEVDGLKFQIEQLSEIKKYLDSQILKTRSENQELQSTLNQYKILIDKLSKENSSLKNSKPDNPIPSSQFYNRIQSSNSPFQVSNLESQLQTANSSLAKCQEELLTSNSNLSKYREELSNYKHYIKTLQKEKSDLEKKYENDKNESNLKLQNLQEKIKENEKNHSSQLLNHETQLRELEGKIFELMENIESGQKSATDLSNSNADFSRKFSESKLKIEELENSVQEKNKKIELCEAEIKKFKEVIQKNIGSEMQRCSQIIENAARESKEAANKILECTIIKDEHSSNKNQEESRIFKVFNEKFMEIQKENEDLKEKLRNAIIRLN